MYGVAESMLAYLQMMTQKCDFDARALLYSNNDIHINALIVKCFNNKRVGHILVRAF